MKTNCWEAKNCGRHPGGKRAEEFGVCPATTKIEAHGLNRGVNGGRVCWTLGGTLCGGEVQGSFATKLGSCMQCDFYLQVRREERDNFLPTKERMKVLQIS